MAFAARFLSPIRQSFSSIASSPSCPPISHSSKFMYCKFELIKTWMTRFEPVAHNRCSRFPCNLNMHTQYIRNIYLSGSKLSIGSMLCAGGVSFIIGSVSFSPHLAYAMDGLDILVDDQDFLGGSDVEEEEDSHALWTFVRKFWLPSLFLLTLLVYWDNPILLMTKVIFFLLSTKPSPLSVYVFVEQLCHQSMRQEPRLYFLKSLYANKVEVQDYKLLCLARVELRNQKLILVGILGGWWALPLSRSISFAFG